MNGVGTSKLDEFLKEQCCLCIGAGVTGKFVGGWKELLGIMLGRRFVSNWLDEKGSYSDISQYDGSKCFSDFFREADLLELGEYLLSDKTTVTPQRREFHDDLKAWQERLFSRQVSDLIHAKICDTLERQCGNTKCPRTGACPLRERRTHELREVYKAYKSFKEELANGRTDERDGCFAVSDFGTAMSVVELCASGKIRHVINYNFDLIVEETLFEVIAEGLVGSSIRQIHIWTYGSPTEPRKVLSSPTGNCTVILHQGYWNGSNICPVSDDAVHFFHVHGVGPGHTLADISGQLIFSQHSYTIYQGCLLNWSSVVMEYLLSHFKLLGVGFSGTDPNFRLAISNHLKSEMEGLSVTTRKTETERRDILFMRAKKPYRDAIKKYVGTDEVVNKFLDYCTAMVENYYDEYFCIGTDWRDDYVDVAYALSEAAQK